MPAKTPVTSVMGVGGEKVSWRRLCGCSGLSTMMGFMALPGEATERGTLHGERGQQRRQVWVSRRDAGGALAGTHECCGHSCTACKDTQH